MCAKTDETSYSMSTHLSSQRAGLVVPRTRPAMLLQREDYRAVPPAVRADIAFGTGATTHILTSENGPV